jgi:hypothetical protein
VPFECIFCGSTKQPSREHVVSTHTRHAFNFSGSVSTFVGDDPNPRNVAQQLAVVLTKTICEPCNNQWLNQLEEKVRPFFHQMMLNAGTVTLDATMQRDFARWATLKAMLIERCIRKKPLQARPTDGYDGSKVELAWLANKDDPPPWSRVWLGSFDAKNNVALTHACALSQADGSGTPAHVTTVTWGYTVFQVFSTNFVAAESSDDGGFPLRPPPPYSLAMQRVWPTESQTVIYPRTPFISLSDLHGLRSWGGLLLPTGTTVADTSQLPSR